MLCAKCGTENEQDRKFCGECGKPLAVACPSCGTANAPGLKFCGECGGALSATASASPPPTGAVREAPVAERRLVSVLFADLVGFTTLSEDRDAEEVRELLTRYFDTCRQLIARYGGTIEKFIGDAVMAVWGTPVAMEDDAERVVRAALDLTAAVAALGQEVGAPGLRARAGVLTGEAAVTIGAEGQGMVAGDLVNTASRIQSVAEPGAVLVGESTKRATEAAIVYEDAGAHELKGKAEAIPLWRAVRVVGLRGGVLRSAGLEPPFVGRDRELRLIKELYHASAEEGRANLVSVVGIGGIGKSRLAWEFEKYFDGLADDAWWHRGRCLAYGDGVAFWALTEMVRMRAGILEDEDPRSASAKLREAVDEHVPDPNERRFVEPRLAQLLGLEDRGPGDQENLFSAWRLFFERLSETLPVILLFEDLHWGDSALLDFIEYLLEWSRDQRIFILTLARPELMDRRPTWGAGKRAFTSLFLDPLPPEAMETLLTGPVPGLPDDLRAKILERAEGVPFYAVETVRMLLDRGLIVRDGDAYRPVGAIETLEVPETLQALIAARLDGLAPEERRLLQDASVLGKSFTIQGLVAMTGAPEAELETVLASLARKEVLAVTADPMSPERGQYAFLQDLVKKVAYDTMSRKERKVRHLAAVAHLLSLGEEDEIIEVVAAHYLDAYRAAPDAKDAEAIKEKVRGALGRAGERAGSLGAHEEAERYLDQAADLTDDPVEEAELLERAGISARSAGDVTGAVARFERSVARFEEAGKSHPAARVSARLGEAMWDTGRLAEALDMMDRSVALLAGEEPDEDLAALTAQLGRFLYFAGKPDPALERIEAALDLAESYYLPEVLAGALNTKAVILYAGKDRRREGFALLKYALEICLENDLPATALRSYYNLADLAAQSDRYREARGYVEQGLALARRVGNRTWEWAFLGQAYAFFVLGEWDRLMDMLGGIPPEKFPEARISILTVIVLGAMVRIHRGEPADPTLSVDTIPDMASTADVQERMAYAAANAIRLHAAGETREALDWAERAIEFRDQMGTGSEFSKEGFQLALEAAFDLSDLARVRELLSMLEGQPRGKRLQSMDALALRFRGKLAATEGDGPEAERSFKVATGLYRELEVPFPLAVTLLEHGEWLVEQGRGDDAKPLLDEAREIFERLKARPWLERLESVSPTVGAEVSP